MIPTAPIERKGAHTVFQDDSCGYSSLFAPSDTEIAGCYHSKNYSQRKKMRKTAVEELVQNNFDPKNCLFITLHFDPKTYAAEPSSETEDKGEDEFALPERCIDYGFDLVGLSNTFFSSPAQSTEPVDVEPELIITNEGYQNLDICYGEFKKFIKKMNYRYKGFKYVAVFDRQKKTGNWHYHLICNLNYIDHNELKKIWSLGGVYIKRVNNNTQLEKVISYFKKNMTLACGSLKKEKGYYASKGLNRNKTFRLWKDEEVNDYNKYTQVVKQAESNGLKPTKRISEHKYTGSVNIDDIFEEKEERVCTVKYYSYRIDSSHEFTKTIANKQ